MKWLIFAAALTLTSCGGVSLQPPLPLYKWDFTYPKDATVYELPYHYQSLQYFNTNHYPPDSPAWWKQIP